MKIGFIDETSESINKTCLRMFCFAGTSGSACISHKKVFYLKIILYNMSLTAIVLYNKSPF